MKKKIFALLSLCACLLHAFTQNIKENLFFNKYAAPVQQTLPSFFYLELNNADVFVSNKASALAVRKLDEKSFIVDQKDFPSYLFLPNLVKHFIPANNLWKVSPNAEFLMQENSQARFIFIAAYKSENGVKQLLDRHPVFKKYFSFLRDQHMISFIATIKDIKNIFLDNPEILSIDVQKKKPKEELALPGFDFSVNKINVAHSKYPLVTGSGENVSIKEQFYDTTDIDLKGRTIPSPMASSTISNHANFIATLIAGGGSSAYYAKGVAWGARFSSSSFDVILPDDNSYYTENSITVQNHSYGSEIDNNYGLNAVAFDKNANDNPGLLHVFSAGNSGADSSTTGRYAGITGFANLTGNYKMAKNVLIVGAVDSFGRADPLSSKGPAYDGRLKPDLVAFEKNGTSESAAIVSGTSLLLQQYYKTKNNSILPSALTRAILINTSDDVNTPGPDYATGFGNLNAFKSMNAVRDNTIFSGISAQGNVNQFIIDVPTNISQLKVTLVWNDTAATAFAPQALVNDLDLQVSSAILNKVWKPWVLNTFPDKDSLSALPLQKRDSVNTCEQVTISDPSPGIYQVNISGYRVMQGGQKFYVVYSYDTAGSFQWQYPADIDFWEAGKRGVLRWETNFTGKGEIQYKSFSTNAWIPVAGDIDLSTKFFRWMVPDTINPAIVRMKIGTTYFYSDTFSITALLEPNVGFACSDSILLYWNKLRGIQQYEVYQLGQQYMEPFIQVSDTTALLPANKITSKYFSVAPVIHNSLAGVKSYGFDYTLQGTGCYIKAFSAGPEGAAVKLWLSLGSIYKVSRIGFEKLSSSGYVTVYDTTVDNQLEFPFSFKPLTKGVNIFRAKIILSNGKELYSDNAQVYYVESGKFVVFPVPAQRNNAIEIFTSLPDGEVMQVTDMIGRVVLEKQIQYPHEFIKTSVLQPGAYFYRILHKGIKIDSGKLLIL